MHPAPTMPRVSTGLLLTVLLHLILLYALLQARTRPMAAAPHRAQPPIQWLRLPPLPRVAPPVTRGLRRPHLPSQPTASRNAPMTSAAPSVTPRREAIAVQPNAPGNEPPTPDLTTPNADAPRSVADIMQQARRDLAGIDRELRKQHPERGSVAPPDSKQARLARGFEAAHAAVLPKWYEGATMEEITGGDDRKRVYRVKSALGMFCITLDQDGKKNYTNCPQ